MNAQTYNETTYFCDFMFNSIGPLPFVKLVDNFDAKYSVR